MSKPIQIGGRQQTARARLELTVRTVPLLCKISFSQGPIPPGRHIYPFEFTLPSDMPSSFNGQLQARIGEGVDGDSGEEGKPTEPVYFQSRYLFQCVISLS